MHCLRWALARRAVLASVFLRERLTVLRAVAILIGVVGAVIPADRLQTVLH